MGTALQNTREQALLACKLKQSFYAYDPPTETTAARLRVFHRWVIVPGGRGHIHHVKARHALTIATIVDRVLNASRLPRSETDAKELFDGYTLPLVSLSVDVIQARNRFAEITGTPRYWHCQNCRNRLELAAPWCTHCGTVAKGQPITAAQAHADLAATT